MVGGFSADEAEETQNPLFTSLRAPFQISLPCHCLAWRRLRLRLRSSFDREYSSPAYAPTPRKYATSPLGNHGAGSRCPRHTLYYRTTRTSEPDLRSGHVRRLVETPHSGPRGQSLGQDGYGFFAR